MKKRVMIVTSRGGHFDQAIAILPAFHDCDITLVTYKNKFISHIKNFPISRIYQVSNFSDFLDIKLFTSLFINFFQFTKILFITKPHIIISTGSEIAIPAFCAAKLFSRAYRIHVETAARTNKLSLSGKTLLYLAHKIYVQWPNLTLTEKKNIVYKGRVY